MKALIFAAGLGTRLRPLTDHRPKALVEVKGEPMLQRVLLAVKAAGITDVVVNVHHFAEMIKQFLAANANFGLNLHISDESSLLLDTGGGLLRARRLLEGDEDILLHNADIFTDLDLRRVSQAADADATLLVSSRASSRQLCFTPEMQLCGWVNHTSGEVRGTLTECQRSFQGIHCVSPRLFPLLERYSREVARSEVFPIVPFYLWACSQTRLHGLELDGYDWHDIGRISALQALK